MDNAVLVHKLEIADQYLHSSMKLGFHAHNNRQMAYSNALSFIEFNARHDIMLDASIMGMGKGAGNLCTELIEARGSDLSLWKLSYLLSQYRTVNKNGDALSKRINSLLEERTDSLKLLKELRDNDLAHNGKELLENEDTFARVALTIGDYKLLIHVAYTILNEVDVFLNNNCFVLNLETEIETLF